MLEKEQGAKDRVIPAFGADVDVISRSYFVVLTIKQRLNSPFPPALIVPVLFIKLLIKGVIVGRVLWEAFSGLRILNL